ncbi:hypothetical protein [Photorhabdus luminescens]|uniref:Uncharacterized protein n=1 Tax=Photorhabdus luminescens subsp. mexicana TaxID=2100167 RepID=A0A4R4IRF4_PHOLU|nr:hypothetical protein [Photorhabdus luminescens]TDB43236.1 hypothetical protein C5468_24050 [Photorhabdus luminescens subsp. mexicana]
MSDYYTEASFIVPCSGEQASVAIEALTHIYSECTEFARTVISEHKDEVFDPKESIIRHCFQNHPDRNDDSFSLEWDFILDKHPYGLWIHAGESINTEHAAIFTQAVLIAFYLPHLVEIQAAHTCSKQRTDAFGGHTCIVSKDHIRWNDLCDFLEAERKAHKESEKYFVCNITEVKCEYEYGHYFLMKCSRNDDPEKRLNEILVNYSGEDNKKGKSFSEITPLEFKVMQAHLNVF